MVHSFIAELVSNFFKKAFTKRFPKQKLFVSKRVRGKLHYSKKSCIGCGLCVKACPAHALEFKEKEKKVRGHRGICIYCGDCERVCPTIPKSIYFKNEIDNAVYSKKDLIFE